MIRGLAHWEPARDGPLTEAAMRSRLEAMGYRVTRYIYPAGTRFPAHDHDVDKIDGVLSGRFRMTLGDETLILGAGDMLEVPAHARHSAEMVGDAPVLSLDAVRVARERTAG